MVVSGCSIIINFYRCRPCLSTVFGAGEIDIESFSIRLGIVVAGIESTAIRPVRSVYIDKREYSNSPIRVCRYLYIEAAAGLCVPMVYWTVYLAECLAAIQ